MGGRGHLRMHADGGWAEFGGYMTAKIQKLSHQFDEKSSSLGKVSSLFEGVAIHVNGHTIPTNDELKTLMAQHGGKFHAYYSSLDCGPCLSHEIVIENSSDAVIELSGSQKQCTSTTHVIASNLPRAKTKDLRPNQKVVRPEWIVDSIEKGTLLPIQPYIVAAHGVTRNQKTVTGLFHKHSEASSSKQTHDDSGVESKPSTSKQLAETSSRTIVPTTDSSFLSDFYSHSRLHFLSTWKTELADYVRSLSSADSDLTGKKELLEIAASNHDPGLLLSNEHCVMHIDMDCFFVAVGLLSRPHLHGRPVAVTHHSANTPSSNHVRPGTDPEFEQNYYKKKIDKGNTETTEDKIVKQGEPSSSHTVPSYSEIASCSYEARKAGLKNGMFYGKAKELCPDLVAIPYDFEAYRSASRKLYEILCSYTQHIEAVSCDEALLDASHLVAETGLSPSTIARQIREKIKDATGCTASAGIGPNIVLARMATKVGKPNGQHQVTLEQAQAFIEDHSVKDLPGVGYSTAARLKELGALTCGSLQLIPLDQLKKEFGIKTGQKLHDLSRGVDNREVSQSKERKSVSADVNYGIRLTTEEKMKIFLANLAREVSDRLHKAQVAGKKVTLKVMVRRGDAPLETAKFGGHGVCHTLSRSKNLDSFTDDCDVIKKEAILLMKSLQVAVSDLRGIGIQLTQLQSVNSVKLKSMKTIDQFVKSRVSDNQGITFEAEETAENRSNSREKISAQRRKGRSSSSHEIPSDETSHAQSEEEYPDGVSTSFLDALPDDIRAEVERDLKAHQMALKNSKQQQTVVEPKRVTSSTTNQPKSKTRKKTNKRKSPTKRSRGVAGSKPGKGSPNKLITDMFKTIPKSFQPNISSKTSAPNTSSPCKPPARRRLNHTQTPTGDRPPADYRSPPSLGGATTVSESRDAIRRWTETFVDVTPVASDVEDVIRYLGCLVTESRDLEGANLVLRTFRRSVMNIIEHCDIIDTQTEHDGMVTSWIEVYNRVAASLCDVIKENYDGAILSVKYIT